MAYLLNIIIACICAYAAEKRNNRVMLFFTAAVLSLFCGLRNTGIGVDTIHYYDFLSVVHTREITYGSDIGFSVISYILMSFLEDPHTALLIFAVITNCLIIYRLWDFRDRASFALMVFIYSAIHYPYTFNIVRQFLAIAVVFWATRYIERNKYFKYILANIIAATLHTSALVCFVFLFVSHGFRSKSKKFKVFGFGMAIIFVVAGLALFNVNIQKYMMYFEQTSVNVHLMTIFKVVCVLLIIIANHVYTNPRFSVSWNGKYYPMNKEVALMYQGGLFLAMTGMFYLFMNRVGFYFMMYEMPFWGQSVKVIYNRNIYRLVLFLMLAYILITTILWDTSGLMDYSTYL